ncbi:hypothetical protein PIB30_033760 [Stylosanthes scabra]|uniref:Uncharacterized protein n=1 Tax=Stylosanthes scabra TaxID=79078 RepID=A0ABU6SCR8_9FABA|nr:hypothetical protein [Stylosanthes scabra]
MRGNVPSKGSTRKSPRAESEEEITSTIRTGIDSRRSGIEALFDCSFNSRAGEACFAYDFVDAWVVQDGYDELLELELDGEEWLLLLLRIASTQVCGRKCVGDW